MKRSTVELNKPGPELTIPSEYSVTQLPVYCDVRESLAPVIFFMKLFGLYHDWEGYYPNTVVPQLDEENVQTPRHSDSNATLNPSTSKFSSPSLKPESQNRMRLASKCYCIFVIALLTYNTIRFLYFFIQSKTVGLLFNVVVLNWYVQNLVSVLLYLMACWSKSFFRAFYKQWKDLFNDPITRDLGLEVTNCRTAIVVMTTIGLLFMVVNNCGVLFTFFYTELSVQPVLEKLLTDPLPVTIWSQLLVVLLHIFNSGCWSLTTTFVLCAVHLIAAHFKILTKVLQTHIEKSATSIPPQLKELRTCHLRLCRLLETLNGFLKYFVTITYLATIIGCCFLLYMLIYSKLEVLFIAMVVFWLTSNVLIALALSVGLSQVHEAAHEPLEELFNIQAADEADTTQAIQLQLFLSKLTGTSIGATVLDLFTITKEALLTIAGAYLTYFLLLIQFNP
ncbi:uncharacterized protein LOC131940953 [Physella acuta]|uniref:uncharacterized protein LOC131940953 n=1 Tax=Physella acuta TaxID=109671 RepID=UPI0027DE7AB7|nr:uncharacterized protein LOC131940953 [Physella acuta]